MSKGFNFDARSRRIELANQRLRDAFARKPGAPVPVVDAGGYSRPYTTKELLADFDKMLDHAVRWANTMAASDNDWPPFIDTYVGVCMVAEAFGCEVVFEGREDPWTRPAVSDLAQVWQIKPPKVGESYMIRRTFEWIDFAQRKLGAEVPVWTMDLQSPFSVAAHIVDATDLLAACYTDPKAVHHLCDMITDFSIEMMQQHIARMERPNFPGRNFPSIPDNIGICIADDTPLIMLSPEMYREFALPYNSRIGDAFSGIHIHSCGDYRHNMENLLLIRNIRSVQLHAGVGEFPLPATPDEDCAFNRTRGKVTMLVDANRISRGDEFADRPKDFYADYMLPRLQQDELTGVILQSCGPGQDLPGIADALAWTRRQLGATR